MTGNFEPLHLMRTKLYRPRVTGELVHRSRVCELLERHLDRPVTLVCAPAGFGKTTLLSDCLEHSSVPSAWLSLDKGDSDVGVFLSYLVAAIRTLFPAACADTLELLRAPVLPPLGPLVTTLANDLDALSDDPGLSVGGRFILVLDDYHVIRESAVHALLGELLHHPPRAMHLIISARQEPPFLQGPRARGELGEIRTHDLRFTGEEIALFMQQALGMQLDAAILLDLAERSEGWGTGLRLAALTLSAGGNILGPEVAVAADNRYVLDYLMTEVLSHVPPATHDFLLKTSILDRLCGPLCDAVAGRAGPEWDGRAYLAWLASENLFTFSLDAQGIWYRYHHLFNRLLRGSLERHHSPQEITQLHVLASGWFARNGLVEEAIDHALAAGDQITVVELVEGRRHEAMNHENWRQLERWLSRIPRTLIDARPELLIFQAWVLLNQWKFLDLQALLDRIEALMEHSPSPEPIRTRLRAEVDTLRSQVFYYLLDGERSFAYAKRALAAAPLECSAVRGLAWLYYAGSRHLSGDMQGALDAFHEGLQEDPVHGNAFATRLYMGLCLVHWQRADLQSMILAATQMLQVSEQRILTEAIGWAHYFLGCAYYQLNDLALAEAEYAFVASHRYTTHPMAFSQSAFGLASILQVRGASGRAREVADSVMAYALEMNHERIRLDTVAFSAWLALQRGAEAEAQQRAASINPNAPLVPLTTFHVAHVSHAKILLARGTSADLLQAAQILTRLRDLATTIHNTRTLIEVVALQALLHEARGHRDEALGALKHALLLAEPTGIIRVFVDLGPRLAILLRLLVSQGEAPTYLLEILSAVGQEHALRSAPRQEALRQPAENADELIQPLTSREMEVVELLGERLSDKEIARELHVSTQTVKRHASNIYQKLGVTNRREAVAKAAALGLILQLQSIRQRSRSGT